MKNIVVAVRNRKSNQSYCRTQTQIEENVFRAIRIDWKICQFLFRQIIDKFKIQMIFTTKRPRY